MIRVRCCPGHMKGNEETNPLVKRPAVAPLLGGLIRRPALAEALANGLIAICPLGGRLKPLFGIGDQVSLLRRSKHRLNSASRSWPSPCCSWPTLSLGILRGITEPSTTPMPHQTAHTAAAVNQSGILPSLPGCSPACPPLPPLALKSCACKPGPQRRYAIPIQFNQNHSTNSKPIIIILLFWPLYCMRYCNVQREMVARRGDNICYEFIQRLSNIISIKIPHQK